MSIILLTNNSLLACTLHNTVVPALNGPSQVNIVSFAVSVDDAGKPYQLSVSCMHSTKDASQIREGPLNFRGQVGRADGYLRRKIYIFPQISSGPLLL